MGMGGGGWVACALPQIPDAPPPQIGQRKTCVPLTKKQYPHAPPPLEIS